MWIASRATTPPVRVVKFLKDEYDIEMTRQAVEKYDPTKSAGAVLAADLRERFYRTREKFRADLSDIPIANKAVRLRALDRMAWRLEEEGDLRGVAEILEQAAKEVGGVYSGRGDAATSKPSELLEPRHPGDDVLREIAERFAFPGADGGKPKH